MASSHSGGFEPDATGVPPDTDAALNIAARLERSLQGALPCVHCGYDLQGMSVLGVCPECGTAVRATILAVVDPLASELKPVLHPRMTAAGIIMWVGAWTGAMLVTWYSTLHHLMLNWYPGNANNSFMATWGYICAGFMLIAAVGAVGIARPHAGTPMRFRVLAWIGALLHVAMFVIAFDLGGLTSGPVSEWQAAALWHPTPDRTLWRIAADLVGLLIIICLRPNARTLVARSLALRTGRVDRQTMLASAAAIVVLLLGDILGLIAVNQPAGRGELLLTAAIVVMAMGGLLMTLGLLSSLVDAVRIARAIIRPGPSIQQVLGDDAASHSRGGP